MLDVFDETRIHFLNIKDDKYKKVKALYMFVQLILIKFMCPSILIK